jgi:hypothetical protein
VTYPDLLDGAHTFSVTATDLAGNVSLPVSYGWTVDTVPPTASITSGPDLLTNLKSATFTFTSDDPVATFLCSKDGGTYWGCSSPKSYWALTDGLHTVDVVAVDLAGNTSAAASWIWTVDATEPVVTILSGPSDPTYLTIATFIFIASESPVVFRCTLDDGKTKVCIPGVTYLGLGSGLHTFTVLATDLAGNVSQTLSYSWRIG